MSTESKLRAEIAYLRRLLLKGVELAEQIGMDCSLQEHQAFEVEWTAWLARAADAGGLASHELAATTSSGDATDA